MQAGPTELTARSAACGPRFFRRGDGDGDSGVVTGACGRHERVRPNRIRVGHRPLGGGPPVCVQSARSVPACGMAADNRSRLPAMCAGFCVAGACRPQRGARYSAITSIARTRPRRGTPQYRRREVRRKLILLRFELSSGLCAFEPSRGRCAGCHFVIMGLCRGESRRYLGDS
jgi:hypothetical protein